MKKFNLILQSLLIVTTILVVACNGGSNITTTPTPTNNGNTSITTESANGGISNGQTNVSLSPVINIKFPQAVNPSTINYNNILLQQALKSQHDNNSIMNFNLDNSNTVLNITFNQQLSEKTLYKVVLSNGIKYQNGSAINATAITFTTGDFIIPEVSIITPSNAETGVSLVPNIQISFSTSVDNVNSNTVSLHSLTALGNTVPIQSIIPGSNNSYTIIPDKLAPNTLYYLVLTNGITKHDSNLTLANTSFYFTTEEAILPQVNIISPNNGSGNNSRYTNIEIIFNLPVKNVNTNNIILSTNSTTPATQIDVTIRNINNTNIYIIAPQNILHYNSSYTLSLSNKIQTSTGDSIIPTTFNFKTYTTPIIDNTKTNIIFVPSAENKEDKLANNLSIVGLNHSLILGQLLYSFLNSNLYQTYVTEPNQDMRNGYPNVAPLQTIEDYTLLYEKDHRGQTVLGLDAGGVAAFLNDKPESNVSHINAMLNLHANHLISMPLEQINTTLTQMQKSQSFTFNQLAAHNYMVMSIESNGNISTENYNDDIESNSSFPNVPLSLESLDSAATGFNGKLVAPLTCQTLTHNPSLSFTTKVKSVTPNYSGKTNTNEIVYLVRHVEAHPPGNLDAGNYVCMGQWRALGRVDRISNILQQDSGKSVPDYLYANNPFPNLDGYMRPLPSINPFAIKHNVPINTPNFEGLTPKALAEFLFTHEPGNSITATNPFSGTNGKPKTIFVSWESFNGTSATLYTIDQIFGSTIYPATFDNNGVLNGYPSGFPVLTNGYDDIFKFKLDNQGNLTFSNTCQGVAGSNSGDINPDLSGSCPLFDEVGK